jgi:quaternary ammonium compound-resistance protein SugE
MAWIVLAVAGVLECVWAVALKQSDGFSKTVPAAVAVVTAVASVVLLSLALRTLPVGTAYAVWTGMGALGVAVVGVVALNESSSPARIGFLLLIAAGIIGLRLAEHG